MTLEALERAPEARDARHARRRGRDRGRGACGAARAGRRASAAARRRGRDDGGRREGVRDGDRGREGRRVRVPDVVSGAARARRARRGRDAGADGGGAARRAVGERGGGDAGRVLADEDASRARAVGARAAFGGSCVCDPIATSLGRARRATSRRTNGSNHRGRRRAERRQAFEHVSPETPRRVLARRGHGNFEREAHDVARRHRRHVRLHLVHQSEHVSLRPDDLVSQRLPRARALRLAPAPPP